ncbi:MAG: WecB/TagA/CpsF family glycosyltransferase [Hyphomonadaceae bacterium]|nr:WecB/TagA/CpsF family glycosyltransferase [Hyphomonadaceae bacterium]
MPHDGFIQAHLTTEFLGLAFSPLTQEQALSAVSARALGGGMFAYVAMPDVTDVAALEADPAARARLYADSWLTLNQSRAIEIASSASGVALPAVSATELCDALLARVIDPDEPVCIVGGDAGMVATIAARYRLNNVRWKALSKSYAESTVALTEAAAFVARARARYTFICTGAPQAEIIARMVLRRGDAAGVALCIGEALLRLCDRRPSAPMWLARLGFEPLFQNLAEKVAVARRAIGDALMLAPIWYYWVRAQLAERASISARSAFWRASSSL